METTSLRNAEGWCQPEFQAAAVNAALILIVPGVWSAYLDYTWDAVRPLPPTVLSSAIKALPIVAALMPIALLVAWRSHFHARAYRLNPRTVWRGPVESAGIAGGIALSVMLMATAQTWSRQPAHLVAAYIALYVSATAVVGLVLGLLLAASALLVIHLRGTKLLRRANRVVE